MKRVILSSDPSRKQAVRESTLGREWCIKIVQPTGRAIWGYGEWPLPTGRRPGRYWTLRSPCDIYPCSRGLHLTRASAAWRWIPEYVPWVAYLAEVHPQAHYTFGLIGSRDKVAVSRARLLIALDPLPPDIQRADAWHVAEHYRAAIRKARAALRKRR